MGVEVHTVQFADGPMVVKDKALIFDAGDKLWFAAAHIAKYHRPLQLGKY
jgi:hypothetical protein